MASDGYPPHQRRSSRFACRCWQRDGFTPFRMNFRMVRPVLGAAAFVSMMVRRTEDHALPHTFWFKPFSTFGLPMMKALAAESSSTRSTTSYFAIFAPVAIETGPAQFENAVPWKLTAATLCVRCPTVSWVARLVARLGDIVFLIS